MGAIQFIIYNISNPPINMEIVRSFINMQNRGTDDTVMLSEKGPLITPMNMNQVSSVLSRRQIAEYRPITFNYNFHRFAANDLTLDGSQPFQDPILNKISKYPILRNRLKRKLLCNGEIYNYNELLNKYKFSDKDICSNSDVEVIMPIYIKNFEESNTSEEALLKTIQEVDGDYSFILTENTDAIDLTQINIFVVKDIFGSKPLYMIKKLTKDPLEFFYIFCTELKGIPKSILKNTNEYIVTQIPRGNYWSYQESIINKNETFIQYNSFDKYIPLDTCVYNKPTPENLDIIYNTIKEDMYKIVVSNFNLSEREVGVLLSGGFNSSILLSLVMKHAYNSNYTGTINVFTLSDEINVSVAKKHVKYLEDTYNIKINHYVVSLENTQMIISKMDIIVEYIETYDYRSVHNSIPFYFLFKYISEKTNTRVLLAGDGLNELCGYCYFNDMSNENFQKQSVILIESLDAFVINPCDKLAGVFGLEIRFPFINQKFIEFMLSINPLIKKDQMSLNGYMGKYIIRKAFDIRSDVFLENVFIEDSVLWNSDNYITNEYFDKIKTELSEYYNKMYSDIVFFNYIQNYKNNFNKKVLPSNKEQMHYLLTYEYHYPNTSNLLDSYWKDIWLK